MPAVTDKDNERLRLFKRYGYDIPKARRFILAKARFARGGTILEIGTGRGHMAAVLAQRGFRFVSIDVDRQAQRVARARLRALGRSAQGRLKFMDAEHLRYKDGAFDYVISVNFIHHAARPERCIREMLRVARKRVVIADVNARGEKILERVHRLDGHHHEKSRMPLQAVAALLRARGLRLKRYADTCQTVFIATKEE